MRKEKGKGERAEGKGQRKEEKGERAEERGERTEEKGQDEGGEIGSSPFLQPLASFL
jgi:hypothetical protein